MRNHDDDAAEDDVDYVDAADDVGTDDDAEASRTLGAMLQGRERMTLALGILFLGVVGAIVFGAFSGSKRPTPQPVETEAVAETPPPWTPKSQPLESHLLGHIEPLAPTAPMTTAQLSRVADRDPAHADPWNHNSPLDQAEAPPTMGRLTSTGGSRLVPLDNNDSSNTDWNNTVSNHHDSSHQSPPYDPADDASQVEQASFRMHRVRDGDTLSSLAQRYLGEYARYQEIYDMNRSLLRDPNVLPIGVELKIPERPRATERSVAGQPRPMPYVSSGEMAPLVPIE